MSSPSKPRAAVQRLEKLWTARAVAVVASFAWLWLLAAVCEASGSWPWAPEFFATPTDARAWIAGSEFSTRTALSRTLLYLHVSGHFTEQHRLLFERYLATPRPQTWGNGLSDWNRLSWNLDARRYVSMSKRVGRPLRRDNRVLVQEVYIENCQNDAFVTAIATLNDREARYGGDSPQFRRWLEAQQQVFDNCSSVELSVPSAPEDGWGALEKQDREYQIAASYFYATEYVRAAELFRAIAADTASPWAGVSRYLVARCLVREATVKENDTERNLDAALALYREMEADTAFRERFPSASGMRRMIEIRRGAAPFLDEIAAEILERPAEVDVGALDDFLYVIGNRGIPPGDGDDAELLRWLRLADDPSPGATAAVVDLWRSTGNGAWLYLALQKRFADTQAALLQSLAADVDRLDARTPARADMLVKHAELLRASGDEQGAADAARRALRDPIVPRKQRNTVQYLLAELAATPNDYLRLAQLEPVALRGDGLVAVDAPALRQSTRGATLLTDDTVRLVNAYFTPRMLLDAVEGAALNDYLRGRFAIAAWVKALLLEDGESARRAARLLESSFPELAPELERHLQGDAYAAARIVVTHPGFSPWIPLGIGRYVGFGQPGQIAFAAADVAVGRRDNNWWCRTTWLPNAAQVDLEAALADLRRRPFFRNLPEEQLAEMAGLQSRMQRSAVEFAGPTVIEHARGNPDDPLVPQTLHRLVFATRYSCETGPGEISRAAFELLHDRYPDTEWARKTPYWFQ